MVWALDNIYWGCYYSLPVLGPYFYSVDTVKETFEFAFNCRRGGTHKLPIMQDTSEADEIIKKLDQDMYVVMAVLEVMGLLRVENTFVGDQQTVRGVSGGEKKRVTVGEMSVCRFPVLCMDEISTGLDCKYGAILSWLLCFVISIN